MNRSCLLLLAVLPLWAQPDVHADKTVTFRFRAPNAKEVKLAREGVEAVPMQRGDDGVWTYTTDALEPDYYGYSFVADGVGLLDPANPLMKPNLLGSTPSLDVDGARLMFEDTDFRPDELKLYPCSLVETADLMQHYRDGRFRPYEHDELLEVLADVLALAPRYCRLSRVVRDISSCDIVVGNRMANLRELAEERLRREGRACEDIRSREIRQHAIDR